MFEDLETRVLFAIPVSGGILQLNGYASGGSNAFELILNGSTIQLRNATSLAVIDSVSASGVTGAKMDMGAGNDLFRVGRPDGTMMPNLSVTVTGNTGNDSLTGGKGNDSLYGDVGNDLLDGGAGADIIDGGAGFDTVDYSYRAVAVKVTFDGTANDGSNSGNNSSRAQYNDKGGDNVKNVEAVLGGSGNDTLIGSSAGEWFDGGGGNDSIIGNGGIDTVTGGVGTDTGYGSGTADYFFMQDGGSDKFNGGSGTTIAQYDSALDTQAPALSGPLTAVTTAAALLGPSLLGPAVVGSTSPHTAVVPSSVTPADAGPTGGSLMLDTTFGSGGQVITSVGDTDVQINDVALESVGDVQKIVAVGSARTDGGNSEFIVIRYNADGSLDTTFGDDGSGIVFTDFSNEYANFEDSDGITTDAGASSLVIDSNGNIVVAGTATPEDSEDGGSLIAVARYNSDGTLDTTFGDSGVEVIDAADNGENQTASRIVLQEVYNGDTTEEEYVLAGTITPGIIPAVANVNHSTDFLVTRLFGDGEQDLDFGDGEGYVQLDYFHDNDFATGLSIDPNTQNIWVSGYTQNTHTTNFLVAGYDQDGDPIDGALTNFDFGADDFAYSSTISDSTLLVVGSTGYGSSTEGAILAVNIDTDSYYYPGQVITDSYVYDPNGPVSLNAVTLDNDGNAVAAGTIGNGDGSSSFYVYQFDPNYLNQIGTPSSTNFGPAGEPSTDAAYGVVVQDDGGIVVAGTTDDPSAALARFQENTAPTVDEDAAANPNPVTGTTTNLTVLGADDGGEENLTYTWNTLGTPPAGVSFSDNGDNSAKNTTATFSQAGDYTFEVTITDAQGLSTTSDVDVTVNQTVTSITVSPTSPTVNANATQQFTATAFDQFGNALLSQPTFTWTEISGVGSIDPNSGLYTAPASAGNATISASVGTVSRCTSITVIKNFVDQTLTPQQVQNFIFTYTLPDGSTGTVPTYLTIRITALKPDGTLELYGTGLDDNISVTQTGDPIITVSINGELNQYNSTPTAPITKIILHGLAGNDNISVDPSITIPVILDGGDGNDTLCGGSGDDCLLGGPGNDVMFGGAGNDTLVGGGSSCNDIMLGGDGNDSLLATGNSRNILIGGRGCDTLHGGTGDDILIGGYTKFDNDCPSLLKIFQEWSSRHNSTQRFNYICGGIGGFNGGIFFRVGLGLLATVYDDGSPDVMTGGGGNDFFIANIKPGQDKITDLNRGDFILQWG